MQWLAFGPVVVLVLVATAVGVRLLWLARRTREIPEAAMGGGLLMLAALGLPICFLGRIPATAATPAGNALFAIGMVFVGTGIFLLYVFTWRVFRPHQGWGRVPPALAACVLTMAVLGVRSAAAIPGSLLETFPLMRPWLMVLMGVLGLAFLWTSIESFRYYRMLRRRMAVGLADAVVTNRFFLWAIAGAAGAVLTGAVLLFIFAGLVVMREPLCLIAISSCGTVIAAGWYLAFLPPEPYRRLVLRLYAT
jgi:hypothetical protein